MSDENTAGLTFKTEPAVYIAPLASVATTVELLPRFRQMQKRDGTLILQQAERAFFSGAIRWVDVPVVVEGE